MDVTGSSILDSNSPVNRYKVLCLEKKGNGRSPQRIGLAFQALDQLIPNLGVYTRIFQQLREDLFDAVFSDQLTGETDSQQSYIEKVPFFYLIQQVFTSRDLKSDELNDQVEVLKERLFGKHKELESSEAEVSRLKECVTGLEERVRDLEDSVSDKTQHINRLNITLKEEEEKSQTLQTQLGQDIQHLQESIEEARGDIDYLEQYKSGYDNLQDAFSANTDEESTGDNRRAAVATKRANLITNIRTAQKLEQQLLNVLNISIEEFDLFMEEHKSLLMEKVLKDDLTESEMILQEIEIDEADQQLHQKQMQFKNTVDEMSSELSLIRKHTTMLQEQLQVLEENKPTLHVHEEKRSAERKPVNTPEKLHREESVLSAGLDHDDEDDDESMDPFIPQERVFSKYAAMLYSSDNGGRTYHEFKDAQFCPSCGEKTVVCPHKLGNGDKVMILPQGCTHIKISRPNVRINKDIINSLLKTNSVFDVPNSTDAGKLHSRRVIRGISCDSLTVTQTPGSLDPVESPLLGGTDSTMINPMNRLWDDYKRRTNLERDVPRPLSLERALSIMEQFFSQLLWQDDFATDGFYSINDSLFKFMRERYVDDDIMYLSTHDFLSSILEYQSTNKIIQLLCHVLVGNIDAAAIRYILLITDFIVLVDWKEVADFRAFAAVVYPFLTEDDLESLQMSYTSFSENKISPQLVCHFIITIILKQREPRFQLMQTRILALQSQDSGMMTETEYLEMIDSLLPLANERLRKRLFWETERHVRMDGIVDQAPLVRVAQIVSYLDLLQITQIIKENVWRRVEEWRERPTSSGSVRKPAQDNQLVHSQEELLTCTELRNFAANVARRSRHRDRRLQMDEDW